MNEKIIEKIEEFGLAEVDKSPMDWIVEYKKIMEKEFEKRRQVPSKEKENE
jgi:hypothetical protein